MNTYINGGRGWSLEDFYDGSTVESPGFIVYLKFLADGSYWANGDIKAEGRIPN